MRTLVVAFIAFLSVIDATSAEEQSPYERLKDLYWGSGTKPELPTETEQEFFSIGRVYFNSNSDEDREPKAMLLAGKEYQPHGNFPGDNPESYFAIISGYELNPLAYDYLLEEPFLTEQTFDFLNRLYGQYETPGEDDTSWILRCCSNYKIFVREYTDEEDGHYYLTRYGRNGSTLAYGYSQIIEEVDQDSFGDPGGEDIGGGGDDGAGEDGAGAGDGGGGDAGSDGEGDGDS